MLEYAVAVPNTRKSILIIVGIQFKKKFKIKFGKIYDTY